MDLEELRAWLDHARGMEIPFPQLQPHQRALLDTLGVVPTALTRLQTIIERIPEDKYLARALGDLRALQRDGWDVTALRDRSSKPPTIVILACREEPQ